MTPARRARLDALLDALVHLEIEQHKHPYRDHSELYAARAALVALFAEQEGEVSRVLTVGPAPQPADIRFVPVQTFHPGDRVRVSKIEEGT